MSTKVNWSAQVISGYTLWVRKGPGTNYEGISIIGGGTKLTITETDGIWCHHQLGWSPFKTSSGTMYIKITNNTSTTTSSTVTKTENSTVVDKLASEGVDDELFVTDDDGNSETNYSHYTSTLQQYSITFDNESDAYIKTSRGVHGMPYQYMPSVDTRPSGGNFGRVFIDKIITRMPLLLLTPGSPKFLNAFSVKQKKDIVKYLTQKDDSAISDLLSRDGRYYDFQPNFADYYKYVNPMCQQVASLLNLDSNDVFRIDNTKPSKYRWENWANPSFTNFISSKESVAFYLDSETQVQESYSNTIGQSQLADKVNGLSDMGREIQFLLGQGAGVTFDKLAQENYDATLQDLESFTSKYLSFAPSSLINKLGSGLLTVIEGGKMIFPEIWNDSSVSRSFSVNVKLRTPDYDVFSWYMNIAVPLIHLLCFVLPQQLGPNSYKSPFLVRGFYKGFFNIDMGIITDMNITKGDQSRWTANGLPTQVDVSFTIKDLYDVLTITSETDIVKIMNNVAMLDYLAGMCGININKPDILRTLEIYKHNVLNSIGIPSRFARTEVSAMNSLDNILYSLYGKFGR